ncbi:hypothetical protein I79_012289 [Cricetulus griseus]|uniref:Uncharacterized protein n=1 Tax=Cricetulus griseus TaxID=10029 RepID=G3HNF1_CRIGR|nr:hypothetical protein I79_012289 [Cricetulus griseus]
MEINRTTWDVGSLLPFTTWISQEPKWVLRPSSKVPYLISHFTSPASTISPETYTWPGI